MIRKQIKSAAYAALFGFTAFVSLGAFTVVAPAHAAESIDDCANDGAVAYICNAINVEDLTRIEGTNWVLAGSLPERGQTAGGFYLMDVRDGSFSKMRLDFTQQKDSTYAACPGAPDPAQFLAHGINIRYGDGDLHQLYVVNHGERETIEIFELDTSSTKPTLAWKGCVIAPEEASLNSVSHLPGAGFATTSIMTRTDPDSFKKLIAGQPSGFVLEWTPEGGWKRLPNSDFPGNNGIEASPDGRFLYIAGWADNTLRILTRENNAVETIDLGDLLPDNIRYASDGSLLIAGQVAKSGQAVFDCVRSDATICSFDYKVVQFNPETMALRTIVDEQGTERFGGATTAVLVGNEAWVGTFRGTRVARVKIAN